MKRAVLYARVSSDDRHREGRSLQGQLDMCRKYADEQGYLIVAELHEDDRGASGAAFELPQLNQVREMAQAGQVDVLVTRELDRLSRSLAKQLFVEEELKRCGVEIDYVLGEYSDTAEGNLMKNVRASIAEFERFKISERMVRGRELKVKSGSVLVYSHPPLGYNVVEKDSRWVLQINEEEARTVRLIFELYTEGDDGGKPLSMYAIQGKLNALQVPSYADLREGGKGKKREYGQWGRAQIGRILSCETYAGIWHYRKYAKKNGKQIPRPADEHVAVNVPAIIDRETWALAQKRRSENRNDARRNLKYEYLLRRRLTCGSCSAKMTGFTARNRQGRRYFYYGCPARYEHTQTNFAHTCEMPSIRLDRVDPIVWRWAKSLLTDPEALRHGLRSLQAEQQSEQAPLRERIQTIDALIADKRTQMEKLLDLYLAKDFPKEMLEERRERLDRAIVELEGERAGMASRLEVPVLTEDEVKILERFAAQVGAGLVGADENFDLRRTIIEALDVRATLAIEDGQHVLYVRCLLGDNELSIASLSIRPAHRASRRHPNP